MLRALFCAALCLLHAHAYAATVTNWTELTAEQVQLLADDDLQRHRADAEYLTGIAVSETHFSEAGFNWHLLRFINATQPIGPLWVVPHDDENAAFDAAVTALKRYGGVLIAVNSGAGSARMQSGQGTCGGRPAKVARCDPNRNFSVATPLFTQAHLEQRSAGQAVIALHTNTPGYGPGKGEITILDMGAAANGKIRPRRYGYFGGNGPEILEDYDSYAILPFRRPVISPQDVLCRQSLVSAGIHVWHEPVGDSDGSLSNYIAREHADIRYVNMESRREADLRLAAERHALMVAAYLMSCPRSGN